MIAIEEANFEGILPDEGMESPEGFVLINPITFAGGLAYSLATIPWVAETDEDAYRRRVHKHVIGTGRDRVTFKWRVDGSHIHGLPRPTERALIAVLVQLTADAGFADRSILISVPDIARRLGSQADLPARNRVIAGVNRITGVRVGVFMDTGLTYWRQSSQWGFRIGAIHRITPATADILASFEWDEQLFAVLANAYVAETNNIQSHP